MTNREVARIFNKLGKVMELHGENPFKIRSYINAYNIIRRYPDEVIDLPREELESIKGIGKNIADKIEELRDTGSMMTLEKYLEKTPDGIVDMLSIKGLGAKKILAVWKDLGIESAGELLYACQENRLVELKGFGAKTQKTLAEQLTYFLDSKGKYLYGHIRDESVRLLSLLHEALSTDKFSFIGDLRRQLPVVEAVKIIGTASRELVYAAVSIMENGSVEEGQLCFMGTTMSYDEVRAEEFFELVFRQSASNDFLKTWEEEFGEISIKGEEEQFFERFGLEYIPPESRELPVAIHRARKKQLNLIAPSDIRGVVHNHSTYSDGANTVSEMVAACQALGYEYLVMSDHSKSAFYANGLSVDRVYAQMAEIEEINNSLDNFRVFKSIESDILYDGQLDYEDDVLAAFDLVIASVHSNLKMNETKATERVLTAVRNKYTRILGHPTGRLLLSRNGYPLDHMAVIDACAEHDVVIELNANPIRLDLDWTWIPYALEKGVKIAINPDAHSTAGILHIEYGVSAARKALVQPGDCINTLSLEEFTRWTNY